MSDTLDLLARLLAVALIGGTIIGGDYACARAWCDEPVWFGCRQQFVCLPGVATASEGGGK